jgi:hypothetical protein
MKATRTANVPEAPVALVKGALLVCRMLGYPRYCPECLDPGEDE